ncbi:MAG: glutathione S-transferase family protein [Hyphomicrobiaceae bacterium]|nr:glutathione S-transferase family protein [Hyphomicrobiaceae bacterium]
MITLYTFGPKFGLPDPSPFVTKVELLLKIAGLPYQTDTGGFGKAPKGKLPYIRDTDGTVVADSTLIRRHIEERYGVDFDAGLSAEQKAIALAFQRLCENHLYFAVVHARWMDDAAFERGPAQFFAAMPLPLRLVLPPLVRRQVRRDLKGQGIGRHSDAEIAAMASADLAALSTQLGDNPYFLGSQISGIDAVVFPFVAGTLSPLFPSAIRDAATSHDNLVSYSARMMAEWFPDLAG